MHKFFSLTSVILDLWASPAKWWFVEGWAIIFPIPQEQFMVQPQLHNYSAAGNILPHHRGKKERTTDSQKRDDMPTSQQSTWKYGCLLTSPQHHSENTDFDTNAKAFFELPAVLISLLDDCEQETYGNIPFQLGKAHQPYQQRDDKCSCLSTA